MTYNKVKNISEEADTDSDELVELARLEGDESSTF